MSFLNQLKSQARALQTQQEREDVDLERNTDETEQACRTILHYLTDLTGQLNVISPAAPSFSLDGKTRWPAMKLIEFRADSRKKMLRNKEAFEYIGMGWRIVPQVGQPVGGSVRVNFPPDLKRVESRLAMGPVKHERKEQRHPEKNTLLAIQFDYITETRGSIMITPDHDKAAITFRLMNATGFDIITVSWPATQIKSDLLDELAKLIVSQPQRFVA